MFSKIKIQLGHSWETKIGIAPNLLWRSWYVLRNSTVSCFGKTSAAAWETVQNQTRKISLYIDLYLFHEVR
jgi:hypothetical protein